MIPSAKKILVIFALVLCIASGVSEAKVYIDITSPDRRLPIAVHEFEGAYGREISSIVRDDLDFSGVFDCLDRATFVEDPGDPFDPRNWTAVGAEMVLKGKSILSGSTLKVSVLLYDVFETRPILRKEYTADKGLLRLLSHTIANDVYKAVTGADGVFRTKVAFVKRGVNEMELYISDWDGQRMRSLGIRAEVLLAPHWSSDGGRLLYSAEGKKRWGVYMLDFGAAKETLVYASDGTLMAGGFFPDGRSFVFSSSREGTPDIYSFELPTSRLRRLTQFTGIEVSPVVSPDGERIAFVSDLGGTPQVYTMDRNGYNRARVTFGLSYCTSPAWSPKGDRLVFSGRYEGRNQIFIVRPDGSGLKALTATGNNEDPSFSPDGRFIVFTSDRDGRKGIYIMRADGESQRRITPMTLNAYGPKWSPE